MNDGLFYYSLYTITTIYIYMCVCVYIYIYIMKLRIQQYDDLLFIVYLLFHFERHYLNYNVKTQDLHDLEFSPV